MKKARIWLPLLLAALLLCGCGKADAPLKSLRKGYTPKQAERDGCVVLDGSAMLAGEALWDKFYETTQAGNAASLRLYQYFSKQSDAYFVKDLSYDGAAYHLRFYDHDVETDEEYLFDESFTYLNYTHATLRTGEMYYCMLADHADANGADYYELMLSSLLEDNEVYDHCRMVFSSRK